jgi:hypothetical protein
LEILHNIYDFESPVNKTHIIYEMHNIDKEHTLTVNVLEKAKKDTNYSESSLAISLPI